MTPFRFRLEKVLQLRQKQLELEEAKYQQRVREAAELEAERSRMEAAGIGAETQVRAWSPVTGSDLAALANYRKYVAAQEQQIAVRHAEARKQAEEQQKAMLEARRRCQLLERLKERRLAEWQASADKELEQLAAESHLARLSRQGF
jgi:flagellar export protein FliJ